MTEIVNTQPPALQPSAPPTQAWAPAAAPKSRTVAAALAILFGSLGLHKFYLGKAGLGVLYLVFFWAYIPGIVGWIEGMSYLAKSDEDWAARFGGPVQRANRTAIAVLWVLALLPLLLSLVAFFALLLMGGPISDILAS